jgi:hypothetical protein
MIKDILTPEVTIIIVTAVILPFLVSLSKYLSRLFIVKTEDLQKRIENDRINNYIDHAQDAVITAVDSITQTFVKSLKESGTFTKDSAKEAFDKAKKQALYMISDDAKEALTAVKGDVDVWVTNKIESYIKQQSTQIPVCSTTPENVVSIGNTICSPTPIYTANDLKETNTEPGKEFSNPEVIIIE